MPDFFVYTCRECHIAYAGALEPGDVMTEFEDRTGLCVECLERLVGWRSVEEVESREENSGTTPNA
jgi:hypothetical protein